MKMSDPKIKDATLVELAALGRDLRQEIFNVGSGGTYSVNQLVKLLVELVHGGTRRAQQLHHQGIALAVDQINAAGGIKGKKLQVIALDDQGKPEEAAIAATRLIVQDKISVLLGEVASSRSLAASMRALSADMARDERPERKSSRLAISALYSSTVTLPRHGP